ncbi:MAG: phosphatase PAP2 family protein [Bacteroidetes bacterium]|nr:phosphatase PAP2 family protein [Bacteroidota bacterium]MBS1755720.1 phosphatase PAP2 family protein [Bacteroidota bacterium]
MHKLIEADRALFYVLNGKWHNSFFDWLMPFVRNSMTWIPLYLFLLLFVAVNYKKDRWWWLAIAAATAIISDAISSDIIKENIWRTRPCSDPTLGDTVRFLLNYRPQSSSFTSSHAFNHFSMASYFYYTLKGKMGKWALLFFAWAGIISYAQVYVGVHFPIDVICGGLIGFVLGYLSAKSFNKNYELQ